MSDEPLIVISPARFILPKNMNKVGLGKGELENKGRRGITDLFDDEPTIANKINIDTEKLTLPPPLLWDTLPSVNHPDYAHIINKYAQETIATMIEDKLKEHFNMEAADADTAIGKYGTTSYK